MIRTHREKQSKDTSSDDGEEKPGLDVERLNPLNFLIYDPTEPVKPMVENNRRPNLPPRRRSLKSNSLERNNPETDV